MARRIRDRWTGTYKQAEALRHNLRYAEQERTKVHKPDSTAPKCDGYVVTINGNKAYFVHGNSEIAELRAALVAQLDSVEVACA